MSSSHYTVHPSSYVDQPCQIGRGTKVWHFCHIEKNSLIGENCTLGQNVHVASGVVIGNNVKIQNNVSVYTGVEMEDDVFCGPSCVFTNVINPRSEIPRRDQFKLTLVRQGATIGANAYTMDICQCGGPCPDHQGYHCGRVGLRCSGDRHLRPRGLPQKCLHSELGG